MTIDALANFLAPLGFLTIMVGSLRGFMDLTRGYPGGIARIIGGFVLGGALIAAPAILPALTSTATTVAASPDAKDTTKDTAKDDTGENTSLFGRVFATEDTSKNTTEKTKVAEQKDDATSAISAETVFVTLAGVAAFAVTLGLIAAVYFGVRHQRRKQDSARKAAEQARAEEEARLDRVWDEAVTLHDHLRAEMMRHQSDIDLVLSMPLINDQSDEKTAAFTEALARAADLSHDTRPTSASAVEAYAAATRAADRAWGAAWRNADRVRLSQFAPEERATIKQVAKLMDRAEHETSEEARATYYRKAVAMLGNLIEIPRPAAEAIEQHLAGVLANPAASEGITVHDVPDNIDQSLFASLLRKTRTKVTQ